MTGDQFQSWYNRIGAWQDAAHTAIVAAEEIVCEACEFRATTGCISIHCPVFRLLDQADRGTPKLLRKVAREWPTLTKYEKQ